MFFSQEGGTSVAFIHMQTAAPGVLERWVSANTSFSHPSELLRCSLLGIWACRVTHLGRTFKHAFVLMDNSTLDDAACQDASFR